MNESESMSAPTRRHRELRKALRILVPLIPYSDSEPVLESAAKLSHAHLTIHAALWLALVSHVRHRFTDYDALLREGYDRDAARFFVIQESEATLREWGCSRRIVPTGEE
jgi:hypothetical protein